MQKKWLIAVPLILILLVLCAAMVVVGIFSYSAARVAGVSLVNRGNMNFTAEETEERTFDVNGPAELTVDNFMGQIRVEKGTGDKIVVETRKEALGLSQQDAQANLEKVTIDMTQNGDALEVRVVLAKGEFNWIGKVDFVIRVPEKTRVKLDSDNGDLYLSGTNGAANLNTQFGKVEVKETKGGALTATTSNGRIEVNGVQAGSSAIELKSDFGDVLLSNAAGGPVMLKSNNGSLTLENVSASGKVDLNSDFGKITFKKGSAGSLEVKTQNGEVTLTNITMDGKLQATSDFGALNISGCKAQEYDLKSLNGAISLDGVSGKVKAHTDFGDVEVKNGSDASIDLQSQNGKVSYEGSLGSGPHTLRSNMGNVLLRLPAKQALNLDLKTDFGKISSAFEVSMSGEIDKEHWTGKINGGGDLLTATTGNGNITLEIAR